MADGQKKVCFYIRNKDNHYVVNFPNTFPQHRFVFKNSARDCTFENDIDLIVTDREDMVDNNKVVKFSVDYLYELSDYLENVDKYSQDDLDDFSLSDSIEVQDELTFEVEKPKKKKPGPKPKNSKKDD